MKRAVKEHPLGIKNILGNKRISSKRATRGWVYAVTKKYSKQEKFLSLLFKK
jgi:hypothetical protein